MEEMDMDNNSKQDTTDISIRIADQSQIDWINSMYDQVHFQKSDFNNEFILIAEVGGQRAGIGRLVKIDDANVELGGIYVFPAFQKRGVAAELVENLCSMNPFKRHTLWCLSFEDLVHFYGRFGFERCWNKEVPIKIVKKQAWCNSDKRYSKRVFLLCKSTAPDL